MATKQKEKTAVGPAQTVPVRKGANPRVLGIESDLSDLRLNGDRLTAQIHGAVLVATLERTIGGASVIDLTLHDPRRKILTSPMLKTKISAEVDDLHFRMTAVSKSGPDLDLTFEDREVAKLRELKGPMKAYRDKHTRAEFIYRLVKEAGKTIPVFIPELHTVQPIKSTKDAKANAAGQNSSGEQHSQGAHGLGKADQRTITVKNTAASLSQIHLLDVILDTGMSLGANYKVLVSSVACATQESDVANISSSAGYGVFSQLKNGAWPASGDAATDAGASNGYFPKAIRSDKANPNQSIAELVQSVQASADGSLYAQWADEARHTVDVYLGGANAASGTSVTQTVTKRYAFEVKKDETYWTAIQRLAGEVKWRAFFVAGIFYYISEDDLFASQVRAHLTEDSLGVDWIDFDYNANKPITEITVTGRAKHWACPPGTVVTVSGLGPASVGEAVVASNRTQAKKGKGSINTQLIDEDTGRYIVTDISSSLLASDENVSVTLKKPTKALPEPAPKTTTKTVSTGSGAGTSGTSDKSLSQIKITSAMAQPGAPGWGGCRPIFHQLVDPFMANQGLQPGSRKRSTDPGGTGGTSDHLNSNTSAYATDYPTSNGEAAAKAIAAALGGTSKGWQVDTYNSFTIQVSGYNFSVQVLWGVSVGHTDHVHVGMHRV